VTTPPVPQSTPAGAGRDRPRVALVFGGRSTEHAISCVSAGSVLAALDHDAWDVVCVGIARDGRWVLTGSDPEALRITDGVLPEIDGSGPHVVLAGDPTGGGIVAARPDAADLVAVGPSVVGDVDVVFPLLHGPFGEDGTVQGLLEMAGVRYVGSGVLASALAMDKTVAKVVLAAAGLPVAPWVTVTDRAWRLDPRAVLATAQDTLQLPVFVKPARAGSSFGITRVDDWSQLEAAVEVARGHDPKVLVEQGIAGREIEVGVLEGTSGGAPEASVAGEIVVATGHAFYDFEAKYLDDSGLVVPADLPPAVAARVRAMALEAFEALGCEGFARADFFVSGAGELPDDEVSVVCNEVNTIPGFTPASMFPRLWQASGLDYPKLVQRMLETALNRRPGLR
jgi:D-alanine-D-alanine ligase